MEYCNIVTVYFNKTAHREKVLDVLMKYGDISMPLIHHPKGDLNSECIIFVLPNNTNNNLCERLKKIRDKNYCTVDSTKHYRQRRHIPLISRRINESTRQLSSIVLQNVLSIIQFLVTQWFNGNFPLNCVTP